MPDLDGLKIGVGNWLNLINDYGKSIREDFWQRFIPVPEADLQECEFAIGRRFPEDFREFMRVRGSGPFAREIGGDIYSPGEIKLACDGGIVMCAQNAHTQTPAAIRRLYVSHGRENPAPAVFMEQTLTVDGINLLDLVQIGTDGMACYHQLICGPGNQHAGYCLLTPDASVENRQPDFSAALVSVLGGIGSRQQMNDEGGV